MAGSFHKELKYGSETHDKLRDAVLERFRLSQRKMQNRHAKWEEAENLYLSYVPKKEEEAVRERESEAGDLKYSTIILPYSYAMLLTAHTYWSSVFLGRAPVLQYTGRHGETHQKVQAIEAVIDYQVLVGRMLVPLYAWLLDSGKYGMGVLGTHWAEDVNTVSSIQEVPVTFYGIPVPGKMVKKRISTEQVGYAGNRVFNVRPQDFYPDPRVSLANFQLGEFCARYAEVGLHQLKSSSEGYFNLKALEERLGSTSSGFKVRGSGQLDLPDSSDTIFQDRGGKSKGTPEILEMTWALVPDEWKLGDSSEIEKWVITVGQADVIIGCRPLGCNHNQFPFALQTYEIDSYSHTNRGMLEIIQPLANVLDWLFNSHFYNVRKSLNDQLVVDPSKVEMRDLRSGGPGRIIRLRPTAYGTDPRIPVVQLNNFDSTRGHLRDASTVFEMFMRATGVNDNLMGLMNPGGRKTATEVRTSSSFGVNRLKTFCEYNSALGWAPQSQMMLQNTQQYLDIERQYKIAGDLLQGDPQFLSVRPEDIQGFYDFVPVDGTMPIDRFAQANLWKEILMGLGQMPQIAGAYDLGGIFSWMAQLAGLKNITQFRLQVRPDDAVANMAAKGEVVPIGQAGRARGPVPAETGLTGSASAPGLSVS